jgi:ACT domain-containing protein
MVQVTQIVSTTMVETGIVKVVTVEARLPTVGVVVGAKKTTTTGITLVNETGVTMIMTTTEVVLGVIAEGEKGDTVDAIERIGLVEIDHMRSLEKGAFWLIFCCWRRPSCAGRLFQF